MKIDPKVEDPLRNAFAAVVDHNAAGIEPALGVLEEEQSRTAVSYAVVVVAYVMNDVHEHEVDAEIADLMAEDIVPRVSEWSGIDDRTQVAAFLLACAVGDLEFTGVDSENVGGYALIMGGNLLSRYRPEGMRWFEYLDQIWNYAESLPDPV